MDKQAQRKHEKPHLLIKVDNNLGATTEIEYTPSTRFYLQDLKAGTPWVTRLPFPVHCVSKVTVTRQWRGTDFSSTYSYHHGYFDGVEREFRGFGRVEQIDIESYGEFAASNVGSPWVTDDHTLYQPPVKTVTWYHTGAALDRQRILDQFAHEYFPQRYADRLPNPTASPTLPRKAAARTGTARRPGCRRMARGAARLQRHGAAPGNLRAGRGRPDRPTRPSTRRCGCFRQPPTTATSSASSHAGATSMRSSSSPKARH